MVRGHKNVSRETFALLFLIKNILIPLCRLHLIGTFLFPIFKRCANRARFSYTPDLRLRTHILEAPLLDILKTASEITLCIL